MHFVNVPTQKCNFKQTTGKNEINWSVIFHFFLSFGMHFYIWQSCHAYSVCWILLWGKRQRERAHRADKTEEIKTFLEMKEINLNKVYTHVALYSNSCFPNENKHFQYFLLLSVGLSFENTVSLAHGMRTTHISATISVRRVTWKTVKGEQAQVEMKTTTTWITPEKNATREFSWNFRFFISKKKWFKKTTRKIYGNVCWFNCADVTEPIGTIWKSRDG